MTYAGGANDMGCIFRIDASGTGYLKILDFNGTENGRYPFGSLTISDGVLYGMTYTGGMNGDGCIFKMNTEDNNYVKLHDFNEIDGANPCGSVTVADSILYGMTKSGGKNNKGCIFKINTDGSKYLKLLDFNDTGDGGNPWGSLLLFEDKLYGFVASGGANDKGCIFKINTDGSEYTKLLDFNGLNGSYPQSTLSTENSILYGMTNSGGIDDLGVVFKYVPPPSLANDVAVCEGQQVPDLTAPGDSIRWYIDQQLTTLLHSGNTFATGQTAPGTYIYYVTQTIDSLESLPSKLTLTIKNSTVHTISPIICNSYNSPSGKYTWTSSGEYTDTIPNAAGCDSIVTVNLTVILVDTSVIQNDHSLSANATGSSFQWIDCNNNNMPIEGETQQTFTASKDGNYAVIVTQNGCTDTSACFTVNVTGLTVNTFKHNIIIYPNPNGGSFFIDLGKVYSNVDVVITELDGRVVQKGKINNTRTLNMILDASPGMYMVIITSENERAIFKIIKN